MLCYLYMLRRNSVNIPTSDRRRRRFMALALIDLPVKLMISNDMATPPQMSSEYLLQALSNIKCDTLKPEITLLSLYFKLLFPIPAAKLGYVNKSPTIQGNTTVSHAEVRHINCNYFRFETVPVTVTVFLVPCRGSPVSLLSQGHRGDTLTVSYCRSVSARPCTVARPSVSAVSLCHFLYVPQDKQRNPFYTLHNCLFMPSSH
ncbi:hypothetical protein J6590_063016 [Homalodisca vitripennis]|nr:hypothetical protein J6590_063016 [Homalodisca vitripennis]